MRERRMGSTARLQDYFTNRLAEMLVRRGKRPAVWNETVADGTFTRDCAVYGWESVKACRQAAAQGYPTVVMPGQYFYFDMRQSAEEEGHNWAAIFDAGKPYGFDLSKQGFTPAEQSHVLGFEGPSGANSTSRTNPRRPTTSISCSFRASARWPSSAGTRTQGVARIQKAALRQPLRPAECHEGGVPPLSSGRILRRRTADGPGSGRRGGLLRRRSSGEELPLHRTGLHDLPGALPVPHPARHGPQSVGRRPGLLPHHYARRPLQQLLQRGAPGPLRTAGAVPGAA